MSNIFLQTNWEQQTKESKVVDGTSCCVTLECLFGFVKDQLRGQRYETTEAIQKAVLQCLRMAGTEFYRRGIFKLPERWKKCVQRSSDYVEK